MFQGSLKKLFEGYTVQLCHLNSYWTERTYISLPGKGLEGHICPTIVISEWRHLERHEIGGANKIITLLPWGMSS